MLRPDAPAAASDPNMLRIWNFLSTHFHSNCSQPFHSPASPHQANSSISATRVVGSTPPPPTQPNGTKWTNWQKSVRAKYFNLVVSLFQIAWGVLVNHLNWELDFRRKIFEFSTVKGASNPPKPRQGHFGLQFWLKLNPTQRYFLQWLNMPDWKIKTVLTGFWVGKKITFWSGERFFVGRDVSSCRLWSPLCRRLRPFAWLSLTLTCTLADEKLYLHIFLPKIFGI